MNRELRTSLRTSSQFAIRSNILSHRCKSRTAFKSAVGHSRFIFIEARYSNSDSIWLAQVRVDGLRIDEQLYDNRAEHIFSSTFDRR